MLDLGEAGIWIRLVDEGVEFLHGFPDGHLGAGGGAELLADFAVECYGLLLVLCLVEAVDFGIGLEVVAELGLVFLDVKAGFLVVGGSGFFGFDVGFHDVDLVDEVGDFFEGGAIPLRVGAGC